MWHTLSMANPSFLISSYGFRQVISTSAPYFPHICCQYQKSYSVHLILCLSHCSCTINVLSTPSPFTNLYCTQPYLCTLHTIVIKYLLQPCTYLLSHCLSPASSVTLQGRAKTSVLLTQHRSLTVWDSSCLDLWPFLALAKTTSWETSHMTAYQERHFMEHFMISYQS